MSDAKKKVLLVEDDGTLRTIYTDLLEAEGYKVDHVVEGEEGLEKIRQGNYDLVLLDILLPGLDGAKILKFLRQDSLTNKGTKIVMLTNQSDPETLDKCRQLGAVIVKSDVPSENFAPAVNKYLGR